MLSEIEQFVNWVRRRNPQARTWKDYSYDLQQFADLVGDRAPNAITIGDIDRFISLQASKGFKPATINRHLAAILSLYTFLSDEDPSLVCPVLPHRHFLRQPQRLPRPVKEDDLRLFFAAIDLSPPARPGHVHPHVALWPAHLGSCQPAFGRSLSGRKPSPRLVATAKARVSARSTFRPRPSGRCAPTWGRPAVSSDFVSSATWGTACLPPPSTSA